MNMKAAFLYGKEDVRIEETDVSAVEAHGLLLKVIACGICGSDARMFFTGPTPRYINPVILGHELTCEVAEVGPLVEDYAVGDLVTVAPIIPCMRCPACSRGQDNLCEQAGVVGCTVHGGMAEYLSVPSQMVLAGGVVKLLPGTDPHAAAMIELAGCCLHGLRGTGGVEPGDRVLVMGSGSIGLIFAQLAKLMGAGYVAVSDIQPHRLALAQELGADETLDVREVDLRERLEQSLDRVITATANIKAAEEAVELVRPGGHLLLFSGYVYGTKLELEVNTVHYRELHLHGSIDCTIRDFRHAARLVPQLQLGKLVTHAFPLDKTAEAFHASRGKDAVKVIVEPSPDLNGDE